MQQKLDVKGLKMDEEVCASVKKLLLLKLKDQRYRLHMHYLNHEKDSKPSTVTTIELIDLCTYWSKEKTQVSITCIMFACKYLLWRIYFRLTGIKFSIFSTNMWAKQKILKFCQVPSKHQVKSFCTYTAWDCKILYFDYD